MTSVDTSKLSTIWEERIEKSISYNHSEARSPYHRDKARIIHSAAFRRLQAKTQVLNSRQNDFYRTRLTHSLEVSQIATGIIAVLAQNQPQFAALLPNPNLIEATSLAHDIGHPPFGHGGETALNYMMRNHGGFEGNAQTLRIVTKVEKYTPHHGMNLTRRTLLGLIKYPAQIEALKPSVRPNDIDHYRHLKLADWLPTKGLYAEDRESIDWILAPFSENDRNLLQTCRSRVYAPNESKKTRFKSLDTSIMELADDIAYAVHDLEDAIVTGIVSKVQWEQYLAESTQLQINSVDAQVRSHCDLISDNLFSDNHYQQKKATGSLINTLVSSIYITQSTDKDEDIEFDDPLLRWQAQLPSNMRPLLDALKHFVTKYVIKTVEVQRLEYRGQQQLMMLFDSFSADPTRLLPENTKNKWLRAQEHGLNSHRVICDYIAGMTDYYAQKLYHELNG